MVDIETLSDSHYVLVWQYGFGWSLYESDGQERGHYVGPVDMNAGLAAFLSRLAARGFTAVRDGVDLIWLDKGGNNE